MKKYYAIAALVLIFSAATLPNRDVAAMEYESVQFTYQKCLKASAASQEIVAALTSKYHTYDLGDTGVHEMYQEIYDSAQQLLYMLPEMNDDVAAALQQSGMTNVEIKTLINNRNGIIAILIGLLTESGAGMTTNGNYTATDDLYKWRKDIEDGFKPVEKKLDEMLSCF